VERWATPPRSLTRRSWTRSLVSFAADVSSDGRRCSSSCPPPPIGHVSFCSPRSLVVLGEHLCARQLFLCLTVSTGATPAATVRGSDCYSCTLKTVVASSSKSLLKLS